MLRTFLATAALLLSLIPSIGAAAEYTPEALHGTPYPLTPHMRMELHVVNRHLDMWPEPASGGGNWALAYGLARSTRQEADRRVAPLQESLGEFPLEAVLNEVLSQRLDRTLFAEEFDIVSVDLTHGEEFRYREQKPGRRILEIHPFFGFNHDGSSVMVSLTAELQDRKSVDRRTRAFRLLTLTSNYGFSDAAIAAVEKPRERMPLWQQQLNRARAEQLLRHGTAGAVDQLNTLLRLRRDCEARGESVARCELVRKGEDNGRRWQIIGQSEQLLSVAPLPPSP